MNEVKEQAGQAKRLLIVLAAFVYLLSLHLDWSHFLASKIFGILTLLSIYF